MNSVRRVSELPQPFRDAFSTFKLFNAVQSDCFEECFQTDVNMVIAAPTGSGKTVTLELCMLRLLSRHLDPNGQWCLNKGQFKVVYVAPTKALIQERVNDWSQRFGHLQLSIVECTGDSAESMDLTQADVIATTPEKLDALSRRCFDTASATIPNVYDIARWIKAPEEGCKVFGEEMRPVTIKTVVKAFPRNAGKNDFLFEKNLNQKVFPILQEFWQQKPVIIFCSSRKGTVECCNKINEASRQQRLQTASYFVRNAEQQARLRDAAATVQDKALADFITQGLAWHHAAMSQEDRATVEKLFLSRDLMCIAATATLAQGVNLPAHLVIIKGTQRYCSDGGKGPSSYQEYGQGECLQMIGRAGRPQFESSATAVIMTKSEHRSRYANLASGRKAVESHLHRCSTEFLNADIAQRIVTSVSQAHAWLQKSLFWVRVFQNPTQYGFTAVGITPDSIAQQAMHLFVDAPLQKLQESGLIEINSADGSITPKDPSSLMCKHCIQLATMIMINEAPNATSPRDLLEIVCKASENADVMLRRTEKKVLNEMNQAAAEHESDVPGSSYMVRESADSVKRKQRLSEPWEKSFVLVNALLAAGGERISSIDYSMINDSAKVIQNGLRIANCMIRYYEFQKRFAAMTAAIRLHRALLQKMWDRYEVTCRQVPGVGNVLVQRLAAAGIRSIQEFMAADPRQLELVTTKLYPWGDTKREDARRLLPPPCSLDVELLGGDRQPKVKVTVQCTAPGRGKTFCWLVVGCLNDDSLLLSRQIDVSSLVYPMELTAMLRSKITGDLRIVAAVLSEKVIGGDTVTPVAYTDAQQAALRQTRPAKTPIDLTNQGVCPSGAREGGTNQDRQDIQPVGATIEPTRENLPIALTEQEQVPAVVATDAGTTLGSGKLPTKSTSPTRRRANWVIQTAKNLDASQIRAQHQPSKTLQPSQQAPKMPVPTVPLQAQTLAKRVEDVKQQSVIPQQQPCHLQQPSQQLCKMPRPPESLQHNVMDTPVQAVPSTSASPPASSGGWQLTTFHAPESTGGTAAVPCSNRSSNPCSNEPGRSTDASEYKAGVPMPGRVPGSLAAFQKQVELTGEASCSIANHSLAGPTAGTFDTFSTPSNISEQGRSGDAVLRDATHMEMSHVVPTSSQLQQKGDTVNKTQASSSIFSCSSHAQPSPESPVLKPGRTEKTCQTATLKDDRVMEVPSLQCTIAPPVTTAPPIAVAAAPPVSRRKALKELIQRARQILAVDPSKGAQQGSAPTACEGAQQSSQSASANASQQPREPAHHNVPPVAAVQQRSMHTEHAQFNTIPAEQLSALVATSKQNGASTSECPLGKVLLAPHEHTFKSKPSSDKWIASCKQPAADEEVEHVVISSEVVHATDVPCDINATSSAGTNPSMMPRGIWDQFTKRGKAQSKPGAPSLGEASAQLWTESQSPAVRSAGAASCSLWSTLHTTPSSLLLASPDADCVDMSWMDIPPADQPLYDGYQVTKTQQPADAPTESCTKGGARTRSLIQDLLIRRSQSEKQPVPLVNTTQCKSLSPQRHGEAVSQGQPPRMPQAAVPPEFFPADLVNDAPASPSSTLEHADKQQGYLADFSKQEVAPSPDMPLKSASAGRIETVPSEQKLLETEHKLSAGQRDVDCVQHGTSEAADPASWLFDRSQENTGEPQVVHSSTTTQSSQGKRPVSDAIKAFTEKFRKAAPPERVAAKQHGSCSPDDLENTAQCANAVHIHEKKNKFEQTPVEQAKYRTNDEKPNVVAGSTGDVLQDAPKEQEKAAPKMYRVTSTGPERTASGLPRAVQAARCTGSQGQMQLKKPSGPTVKLPQLPRTSKSASNITKVRSTSNVSGSEQPVENKSQFLKEGAPVPAKRRLGGVVAVTPTTNDNNGIQASLKRAFKVPRSK